MSILFTWGYFLQWQVSKILLLLTLLPGPFTCLHIQYTHSVEEQRRQSALRTLLLHSTHTLPGSKSCCERQFWKRHNWTSVWCDKVVLPEERRENFHMSKTSALSVCELLGPHIEGQTTIMRSPVSAEYVAIALWGGHARQQTPSDCQDRWCGK